MHRAQGILVLSACLVLASHISVSSPGEQTYFEQLSIKDGLPRTTIIGVNQDARGFLWVSTYDGLARYDGYTFINYIHRPDDSTSLGQGGIRHICVDHFGVLWAATDHGVSRFISSSESFTTYSPDSPLGSGLSNNSVRYIYEDKRGELWVGTADGLNRFDRERNTFVRFHIDSIDARQSGHDLIRAIVEDLDGRLLLGTNDGVVVLNREGRSITRLQHNPNDPGSLSSDRITCLAVDRTGALWVGTHHDGLNRLPRGGTRFERYRHMLSDPSSISSDQVNQILMDHSGELWIATNGGGLEKYDPSTNGFIHHKKNILVRGSLSSDLVTCLFEDKAGVLYVGTDFGGLNILDRRKHRITLYEGVPGRPGSLSESHVHAVYEDPADSGRTLWVGTRGGGLNLFDRRHGTFRAFMYNQRDQFSISDNIVRCIARDNQGFVWAGTNNGLNRLDPRTGKFKRYQSHPLAPQGLRMNGILGLFVDRMGTLWVGTGGGGLEEYDQEHDAFIHHVHDPADSNSISDDVIWCIMEDHNGFLWIGTNDGGLNRYDRSQRRFSHYMHAIGATNSITSNKVLSLCEDHAGSLWIGTAGAGLNRFDPASGGFVNYAEQHGLTAKTIQAIVEDKHGCLWLSTPRAILRFDPRSESSTAYDVFNGLQSNEFQVNAGCRSVTGEIFFGGIEGLNSFFPEQIEQSNQAPPVAITGLQLFSKPVFYGMQVDGRVPLDTSIIEKSSLMFSYADEVFTLEFAALDFSPSTKKRYVYKMDGYEEHWNLTGERHFATYRRLPAGHYVFRLHATDPAGTWTDGGTALSIVITPPFWETWWFRILGIALVGGVLLMGHTLRTRRIRLRTQELEERVMERTAQLDGANKDLEAFAYSVSHDLRAPLRAIDGFSLILEEDHAPSLTADARRLITVVRSEVKRMGTLIDDILTFSRLGRATMHPSEIPMTALVIDVYRAITTPEQREKMRFSVAELPSAPGDLALLRQVWSNLISNAVKFSSQQDVPAIEIGSRIAGADVTYLVRDNGVGFDMTYADKLFGVFQRLHREEEFEGTGVGLAIVHRLVQRHGGKVWAESEVGKGATFYFTLPRRTN
jgi:ligand-binding sensor domain-containing protein/signal transduction histidine kinase